MKLKKFLCITLIMILLGTTAILATACGNKEPNAPVVNPVTLDTTPAITTKPNKPSETKPQKETEKNTDKAPTNEIPTEKPTKKPSQKPTKEPEATLPTAAPTEPGFEIPTVKPTSPTTTAATQEETGLPYNPSQIEIPKTPKAPTNSTIGTPNCAARLVELLLSGNINEGDKSSTCSKLQIGIENNGSSTMRIFPYGKVTVSDITGCDRELSLINANGIAIPYLDIPAGGTVYVNLRVLGNPTLFSTQKDGQITTVHFSFYYGNTIYDATCTAGVDGIEATKR